MAAMPNVQPATLIQCDANVPPEVAGMRLDQVAAQVFPEYSRARLQDWIRAGRLTVNGRTARPKDKVWPNDRLSLAAEMIPLAEAQPEPLNLGIVFEDDQLLVLDKPRDTVVHPAPGHSTGTLVHGLLHHCPDLASLPRAGLVHRLDKDTTGLLVVAKTLTAHTHLVRQLQRREITREYAALVAGAVTAGGTIDRPLGRHPTLRKRRMVVADGQSAVTHYWVEQRFADHTLLRVRLETGRTHQIRVHMAYIGHPILGDRTYGGRLKIPRGCSAGLEQALRLMDRQALHARRLELSHPSSGEWLGWESPLPTDMTDLLAALGQAERRA